MTPNGRQAAAWHESQILDIRLEMLALTKRIISEAVFGPDFVDPAAEFFVTGGRDIVLERALQLIK